MQLKICGMKHPKNIAAAVLINVEKTVDFLNCLCQIQIKQTVQINIESSKIH